MPQLTFRSNARIVRQGLEQLRAALPMIGRKRLYDAAVDLRDRMAVPGSQPVYPISWDSSRQKRAFFASDGFGGGIPTVRSDRYVEGWKVERADAGYRIKNTAPGAKYIGGSARGTYQSSIHVGRWRLFRDQADLVMRSLPKLVVENLREFVKRTFASTKESRFMGR